MNTSQPSGVIVLIPTHNRSQILCNTLGMVRAQLSAAKSRIIVVDAGSTDGTADAVRALQSDIEIVQGNADMWWTAAVNFGLKHISSSIKIHDRIILMNDDIDLEPSSLIRLLEGSLLNPSALIGAVNIVKSPSKDLQVYFCGGYYDLRFARHKVNIQAGVHWRVPDVRFLNSDFLYGRLLVIPWRVFEAGCYFDELVFPQYYADEDFSYSAKLCGFQVLVDTRSIVYVNKATTANFDLNFFRVGFFGVRHALTAFNSYYNLAQNWAFARRYATWPVVFLILRYLIIFINENIRKRNV
jgi:GT2 family glycosyltransferase